MANDIRMKNVMTLDIKTAFSYFRKKNLFQTIVGFTKPVYTIRISPFEILLITMENDEKPLNCDFIAGK